MTKEEAINILVPFRNCMVDQYGCPISDAVYALDVAIDELKKTERKTGKWNKDGFCTVCGKEAITEWNDCGGELAFTKFCPNCGARMET